MLCLRITCSPSRLRRYIDLYWAQDEKGRDLVNMSEAALEAGIAACAPGRHFRGIAKAMYELLRGRDYSICPMFTGHGIGREFHREPWIIHNRMSLY